MENPDIQIQYTNAACIMVGEKVSQLGINREKYCYKPMDQIGTFSRCFK